MIGASLYDAILIGAIVCFAAGNSQLAVGAIIVVFAVMVVWRTNADDL